MLNRVMKLAERQSNSDKMMLINNAIFKVFSKLVPVTNMLPNRDIFFLRQNIDALLLAPELTQK